jgi:hypothetical protein
MIESQENLKKSFNPKWNLKAIDSVTIARLLSELEGAHYILDVVDEHDADIIDRLRKKYYKKYFELKRST